MDGTEAGMPYPVLRGAGVVLPDCSRGIYVPFRLTSREKRDLIRGLAQRGLSSIDEFIAGGYGEGAIADRMEEIRKRIRAQIDEMGKARREAILSDIDTLREQAGTSMREAVDGTLDDEPLFRKLSSEEIRGELLASELVMSIEGRAPAKASVMRPSFFKRVWSFIKKAFLGLVSLVGRLVRYIRSLFLTRREREEARKEAHRRRKGTVLLPFPGLLKDLNGWERELDARLDGDRELQRTVERRLSDEMGYSSGTILLKRSFDPEWYRSKAIKVLREEVRSLAESKRKELEERRERDRNKGRAEGENSRQAMERALEMERELEKEARESASRVETITRAEVRKEVVKALSSMGYIHRKGGTGEGAAGLEDFEITEALVEKFSELIYYELMESAGRPRERPGSHTSDLGVYDRARLRTIHEEARIDMLQTLIDARTNHPDDPEIDRADIIVYREVRSSELHAVILLDISGSMEENMRLEAAKRAVLALSQAVRKENPRNRLDIITVSTRAAPSTLKEVLAAEPRGFTNHSEAIAMAGELFEGTRSDRMLLFLITDGLPEAYTGPDGSPVAGDLVKAMERTLMEVSRLKRFPSLHFDIFLLEPKDTTYLNAAKRIAKEGSGVLLTADPKDLALKLVLEYERGSAPLSGI